MVQTRASAKRTNSGQAPQNSDGVLPPAVIGYHPPGYVSPSPAKKPRRDRGQPSQLSQLNLDVLFLISANINPMDLLNLARTCKSLRELLMSKSSVFVWKTARSHIQGLPDCPADLSEPEYADLVFCARCHGCGKYTKMILWTMRRRYCPNCRVRRLFSFYSCHALIYTKDVLATEYLTINGENTMWVDKEQMELFMYDFKHSSDKEQTLLDKHDQLAVIRMHARECIYWQNRVALARKQDNEWNREQRERSIFEHLKQHGYEREIAHFGEDAVQQSNKSHFRTSKPLTDKEWVRLWPEWFETMKDFRVRRLNATVYRLRRDSLVSEYRRYVMRPSPNTPAFDTLPHVLDLIRFPPFREAIKAPEGTQTSDYPFESAFEQLPVLVDGWRRNLEVELAELVKVPIYKDDGTIRRPRACNTTCMDSSQAAIDKLHLACAVFDAGVICTYPDVLSISMHLRTCQGDYSESTEPLRERFGIKFMEDAPYIVHACGLDPNVATAEDMDRRNARLKCLSCDQSQRVMRWRDALWHTFTHHQTGGASVSHFKPRWQAIGDEHIDAIQAIELSSQAWLEISPKWTRCLLCRPSVGDAKLRNETINHLTYCHNKQRHDIKQDVHFVPLGIPNKWCVVDMREEGGHVTFKSPSGY